jgi:hypothetical protein
MGFFLVLYILAIAGSENPKHAMQLQNLAGHEREGKWKIVERFIRGK